MSLTNFPNGISSFGMPVLPGVMPTFKNFWFVDGSRTGSVQDGKSAKTAYSTVASAISAATAGDVIVVAPGEYDEDLTLTTSKVTIMGAGPRNSVRITGTSAGTKTALTINGASDVGIYNLNLEGRTSSGSALHVKGQIRRLQVAGCKIHGGDQAVLLDSNSSGQIVDIRIEDSVIANSAIGIFMDYNGGDPSHQIMVKNNVFSKITTDCIVENGASHDWQIFGNYFTASDGTEPTQFLDIDETGTTGFVANNVFHTTVFDTASFAIASGVLFANNISQAENPSANVGGTSGRPD